MKRGTIFIFTYALSLMVSLSAGAAGSINLEGELRSFSVTTVEISDGTTIYSIDKNKLATEQKKMLQSLKIGSKAHLTVNFNSILSAKPISK